MEMTYIVFATFGDSETGLSSVDGVSLVVSNPVTVTVSKCVKLCMIISDKEIDRILYFLARDVCYYNNCVEFEKDLSLRITRKKGKQKC